MGMLAWPRVTVSQGNDASFFKLDDPDSLSLSNICLHVLNEGHFYCPAVGMPVGEVTLSTSTDPVWKFTDGWNSVSPAPANFTRAVYDNGLELIPSLQ
jgi:hypothetical protein